MSDRYSLTFAAGRCQRRERHRPSSLFFIQFESIYAEASALADLDAWTSWSRQPGATSRQTELYVTVDEQDYMCKLNLDTVE